jgi:hypothetical protein
MHFHFRQKRLNSHYFASRILNISASAAFVSTFTFTGYAITPRRAAISSLPTAFEPLSLSRFYFSFHFAIDIYALLHLRFIFDSRDMKNNIFISTPPRHTLPCRHT